MDEESQKSFTFPIRRHDLLYFEDNILNEEENSQFRWLPFFAVQSNKNSSMRAASSQQFTDYPLDRLRLLQGIDWAITQKADVISISMGIPVNSKTALEPLAIAIELAIQRYNICVLVAAGNAGPRLGTLQALAHLDGVISVGGATVDGKLLENSSRGHVESTGPTCVADGSLAFPDERFVPCSSFACARASKYAAIIAKLTNLVLATVRLVIDPTIRPDTNAYIGAPIVAYLDTGAPLSMPARSEDFRHLMERTRGQLAIECNAESLDLLKHLLAVHHISIPNRSTPQTVLKILRSLCIDTEGRPANEVGSGFLELSSIYDYFSSLSPVQILKTFCNADETVGNGISESDVHWPLFTQNCFDDFWIRYVDGMEVAIAKVQY